MTTDTARRMTLGYVNVFVSNFDACCTFFTEVLGLPQNQREDSFGYASFNAGHISFGIARTDDTTLVGRHTGVGFVVADIEATYQDLVAKGVEFEMPPTKQPWGGTLALMKDPDGNIYYLDPGGPH